VGGLLLLLLLLSLLLIHGHGEHPSPSDIDNTLSIVSHLYFRQVTCERGDHAESHLAVSAAISRRSSFIVGRGRQLLVPDRDRVVRPAAGHEAYCRVGLRDLDNPVDHVTCSRQKQTHTTYVDSHRRHVANSELWRQHRINTGASEPPES